MVRQNGLQPKFGNLIPEFERCVIEAMPNRSFEKVTSAAELRPRPPKDVQPGKIGLMRLPPPNEQEVRGEFWPFRRANVGE
jgi:hypothetical protein